MSLEASEVAVRVRLVGGSAFQTEAAKVAGSTEAIGKAGASANKQAEASALTLGAAGTKLSSVGSKITSFGRTLTMVGVPLAAAGAYAMKTASTFQQNMTLLATQAGESQKNLGWMSKEALSMAKTMGVLPNDIAQGLYAFESVGVHGKNAMQEMQAAIMGTKVGLDALPQTTDAISTVMASHIKGAGGPIQAMAEMDAAVGQGKMHLADLTDSFKQQIVPMSQMFGVSFPQILAGIAAETGVGTPASQAAARMRLMYTSMVSPSGAGAKALAKAGLGPDSLGAALRGPGGLPAALELLQSHLASYSPGDRNQILAAAFGRSRGMGQILTMLEQLPKIQQIYGNVMQNGTPAVLTQHYNESQNTTAAKGAKIHAQLDAAMVNLGQSLNQKVLPVIARLVPYVTRAVDMFGRLPRPIQDVALGLAGLAIVGGPLLMFTGALIKSGGVVLSAIDTVVGPSGMAALRVGVASTTAEFVALAAPLAAAVAVFELFSQKHGVFADARHGIEGAGKSMTEWLGSQAAALVGDKQVGENLAIRNYLTGKEFKSYSPLIQADIQGLMNPNSYQANHLGKVYSDLAAYGKNVNINDIPGVSQAVKNAVKEGMKEAAVSVYLPNGRILAQTVNEVNRRSQARR